MFLTIVDRKMKEFGFVKLVAYNEKESVPVVCYERSVSRFTSFYVEAVPTNIGVQYQYTFYKKNHFKNELKFYCEEVPPRVVLHKIKFVFSSFLEHEILLDDLHW